MKMTVLLNYILTVIKEWKTRHCSSALSCPIICFSLQLTQMELKTPQLYNIIQDLGLKIQ